MIPAVTITNAFKLPIRSLVNQKIGERQVALTRTTQGLSPQFDCNPVFYLFW